MPISGPKTTQNDPEETMTEPTGKTPNRADGGIANPPKRHSVQGGSGARARPPPGERIRLLARTIHAGPSAPYSSLHRPSPRRRRNHGCPGRGGAGRSQRPATRSRSPSVLRTPVFRARATSACSATGAPTKARSRRCSNGPAHPAAAGAARLRRGTTS